MIRHIKNKIWKTIMACSEATKKLLILNKLKGVGPKTLIEIASIENFSNLEIAEIIKSHKKLSSTISGNDSLLYDAERAADFDIRKSLDNEARIISFLDTEYPTLLQSCNDKPAILYIKGNWHNQINNSIAIIGTREPTKHGEIITERISRYFIEQGWSIVSGLALGCDSIAHQTAVDMRGHTVAVLSHGLHTIAPKQNAILAEQILANGGALVSEYAYGVEARPHQFVARDRIQAALSKAVVMVQSDVKGGSLHASRAAINYGRILAVPYPTPVDTDAKEQKIGANLLLSEGSIKQKMDLLDCNEKALDNLFIIKDKSDYSILIDKMNTDTKSKGQGFLL